MLPLQTEAQYKANIRWDSYQIFDHGCTGSNIGPQLTNSVGGFPHTLPVRRKQEHIIIPWPGYFLQSTNELNETWKSNWWRKQEEQRIIQLWCANNKHLTWILIEQGKWKRKKEKANYKFRGAVVQPSSSSFRLCTFFNLCFLCQCVC